MNVQILVGTDSLLNLKRQAQMFCQTFPAVVICAWCPSKKTNEQALKKAGLEISHGMCEACFATQQARIPKGEAP